MKVILMSLAAILAMPYTFAGHKAKKDAAVLAKAAQRSSCNCHNNKVADNDQKCACSKNKKCSKACRCDASCFCKKQA